MNSKDEKHIGREVIMVTDERRSPSQTKLDIEHAASEAVKVIGEAAAVAAKVVASAASEAMKVSHGRGSDDHDLLIELKTVQTVMLSEIREIKDGTAKRIGDLETNKLDTKNSYNACYKTEVEQKFSDLERRMQITEISKTRQNTTMGIGIGLITILVGLIIYHIVGAGIPH